jgi:hypothetical protein
MSEEPEKPDFKSLDEACKQSLDRIIEHAESVIIIVTRCDVDKDDSWACTYSRGNAYTNLGAVKDWIARKDEATKVRQRRDMEL